MLFALIVAAEAAFWLILLSGLTARYLLGRRRLGMALLVATPVVDLALLAVATIDLRRGGEAALPHALAAVYIGVSVAWGTRIVSWADARFAHRYARGPQPEPAPRIGRAHAARQRREWLRHVSAWGTGTALLGIGVLVVGDLDRTWALLNVAALWTLVLAIDFAISFSYTLWPREEAKAAGVGFEPTGRLHTHRFSRPTRSTAPAPRRDADGNDALGR
jgi:hypothetical protein